MTEESSDNSNTGGDGRDAGSSEIVPNLPADTADAGATEHAAEEATEALDGDTAAGQATPPTYDEVVCSARMLSRTASNNDIREVLQAAIEAALTPAEEMMLVGALKEATGQAVGHLRQLLVDEKNTIPDFGTVANLDQAAQAVVGRLRADYAAAVFADGALYTYGGRSDAPYWQLQTPNEVLDFVNWMFANRPVAPTLGARTQICKLVESKLRNEKFFAEEPPGVNTSSGLVTVSPATGVVEVLPHDPDHRKRYVLDFGYDPDASCPTFLAGLEQRLGDDPAKIAALQEMIGAALVRPTGLRDNVRTVVFMNGGAGRGKSTQLKIIESLHSTANVASVPPDEWGCEYRRAVMAGATLNVVYEIGGSGASDEIKGKHFKALSANERIGARHPGGRPFNFIPRLYHFLACNEMPRTDDKTGGFGRRVVIIDFVRPLEAGQCDGQFYEKCLAERPGILNWALQGAQRLIANSAFTIPADQDRLLLEMQYPGDLVEQFARLAVERDPSGGEVRNSAILAAYRAFVEQRFGEVGAVNELSFYKHLVPRLGKLYQSEIAKRHGGIPHYTNIRIKPEFQVAMPSGVMSDDQPPI